MFFNDRFLRELSVRPVHVTREARSYWRIEDHAIPSYFPSVLCPLKNVVVFTRSPKYPLAGARTTTEPNRLHGRGITFDVDQFAGHDVVAVTWVR
jgi:hypothetical protein